MKDIGKNFFYIQIISFFNTSDLSHFIIFFSSLFYVSILFLFLHCILIFLFLLNQLLTGMKNFPLFWHCFVCFFQLLSLRNDSSSFSEISCKFFISSKFVLSIWKIQLNYQAYIFTMNHSGHSLRASRIREVIFRLYFTFILLTG